MIARTLHVTGHSLRVLLIAGILLAYAGLLGACQDGSGRPVSIAEIETRIPRELLSCKAEPIPPPKATRTKGNTAAWIVDLADAGRDCRDKLRAVCQVVSETQVMCTLPDAPSAK